MPIKKVTIPEFKIYTPTKVTPQETIFPLSLLKKIKEKYFTSKAEDFEINTFHHFPLLLLPNKKQWQHVNNYFLKKLESIEPPHSTTLGSIADSIKYFGNFCLETDVDYLICTRKSNSPLRRFRRHLSDRIEKNELAPSTAKSHISNLVNFYQYLVDDEHINFEFSPWHDREVKIMIANTGSGGYLKTVKTSDVSQAIKGNVSTQSKLEHCTYEGKIMDGGELRPLDNTEQEILLTALKALNHTEMTFIFLIALCTGARLQTILTLRYDNFNIEPDTSMTEVAIYAGRFNKNGNGLVDSKNSKSITLYVPIALYSRINIYLKSKRAIKRREKSAIKRRKMDMKRELEEDGYIHQPLPTELEYVFLSQQGNPFYLSKADEYSKYYQQLPTGQAIGTFISERLKPKLKELGFTGSFKFHDTRATFGMNIVNSGLELIKESKNMGGTIDQLFRFVKVRMCHNQLSTTQQYLDFNDNNKIVKEAKIGWEKHLKDMLDILDDSPND